MHSFSITLALGLMAPMLATAGNISGLMPRSLNSITGIEARQLTCSGSNPNVCSRTANSITCGQNCCSDGTSCEFGFVCASGGRCCDETKPLSQCGVATVCYDATDSRCPEATECCPTSTPFCTYEGARPICAISSTLTLTNTNTIIDTVTSTRISTRTSTLTSSDIQTVTATIPSPTTSSTTTVSSTYSSIYPTGDTTLAPNATAPTLTATPPAFTGAAGRIQVGAMAVIVAVGAVFL